MSNLKCYTKHNPCEGCMWLNGKYNSSTCPFERKDDCPVFKIFDGLNMLAETPQEVGSPEIIYDKVIPKAVEVLRLFGYKGELRHTQTVTI